MINYNKQRLFALGLFVVFSMSPAFAQEPMKQSKKQTLAAAALSSVGGSGTPGYVSKWLGVSGTSTFVLGDSNIFEDKFGKVGIGTSTPTSLLTVQGMIETTMGGYKFPDGTLQTTAGIAFVTHDASLMGDGRSNSPLGIALGGVNTIHLANGAVTAPKIANGTVVRSLNGLFDNVAILGSSNITITPAGNTLTISTPNSLSSVAHDTTLTGNGTAASPLGVADGGIGTTQLADGAVTLSKIALNQVVTSLNNLREGVTLVAGSNITITPSGNTLTIAGAGSAGSVKAMIEVSYDGVIRSCYNGITSVATGNCGFVITEPLGITAGIYRINFGFPVAHRFVSITGAYQDNGSFGGSGRFLNSGANYRFFDSTSVEVFTFMADDSQNTRPSSFMIILY